VFAWRNIPKALWLPLALYPVLCAVPLLLPAVAPDAVPPELRWLPWSLLAAGAVLGLCFAQSRITFTSLLIGVAVFAVDIAFFERPAGRGDARIILLAGTLLPIGMAIFHRLTERGVFTRYGLVRLVVTAVAGGILVLWPRSAPWPDPTLAETVSPWIRLPVSVLLSAACCLPLFFLRKQHENPAMGAFLAIALLYMLTALNFRSVLWPGVQARTVLLLLSAGGAFTLLVAVLDSAWRSATLDDLTQLPGRRALKHRLARIGTAYTLGILDIDHFKQVNDRHGHAVGDQVLRFVAARLRDHFPGRAYRLGGEEFVVLCEGSPLQEHVTAIETARESIGETPFRLRGRDRPRQRPDAPKPDARGRADTLRVTASAGVAPARGADDDAMVVLQAADKALYRAKESGRDRLCTASRKRPA